jgi:ribosomal protein L4
VFSKLKVDSLKKVLLLLDKIDGGVRLALKNIVFLNFNSAKDTYAYEVLDSKKLIITKEALNELTKRLKK